VSKEQKWLIFYKLVTAVLIAYVAITFKVVWGYGQMNCHILSDEKWFNAQGAPQVDYDNIQVWGCRT